MGVFIFYVITSVGTYRYRLPGNVLVNLTHYCRGVLLLVLLFTISVNSNLIIFTISVNSN